MNPTQRRMKESAGMLMIGDGMLGIMYPRDHCLLWRGGPLWWRRSVDWFAARPHVTRVVAAAEVCAGLLVARRQESTAATPTRLREF